MVMVGGSNVMEMTSTAGTAIKLRDRETGEGTERRRALT
eukprot:CAMPEP_0176470464 /NCGR_PEP_ID=MMETSP0127-20121128/40469_1 /TAXON_ID=938130 /ORGANISM="Platyophrya macrostoma, Strain WH" /LENGTH=38 /DNA_ID= /DNA_START= /DNA_END= /DNA_ORIENTATION=